MLYKKRSIIITNLWLHIQISETETDVRETAFKTKLKPSVKLKHIVIQIRTFCAYTWCLHGVWASAFMWGVYFGFKTCFFCIFYLWPLEVSNLVFYAQSTIIVIWGRWPPAGKVSFKDRSIVFKTGRKAVSASVMENKRERIQDLCSREAISITALISAVSINYWSKDNLKRSVLRPFRCFEGWEGRALSQHCFLAPPSKLCPI